VASAIDARMGEIYWGAFEADTTGMMRPLGEERVCPPGQVALLHEHHWHGIGSGWHSYATELAERQGVAMIDARGDYFPHARDVALLGVDAFQRGEAVSAEQALPHYIRDQVVQKPQ
jgi:tRNA threonylcarbamoyladenosine biosynthesis protein TsaB